MSLRNILLALAASSALAACDSYYGNGQGYGYGYGGVSVGYGNAYYGQGYDPYWNYYAANPYWGWYNGFYYPGTGVYVYDQWRRPHYWADDYRRYWSERRGYWDRRGTWNGQAEWRDNWRDFDRNYRDGDRWERRGWDDNRRRDGRRGGK